MESKAEDTAPIQFDTATPQAGGGPPGGMTCAGCNRILTTEYFDVNGTIVCQDCRHAVAEHAETPRELGVLVRAAVFGVVAAVLGAALYYAVLALADLQIGIVAIAIGYMVGYGIRMATGGRGGRRFQIVALVLTYWAVGLAYTPLIFTAARAEAQQTTETKQADLKDAPARLRSRNDAPPSLGIVRVLFVVLLLSFTLPVYVVMASMPGGLISAAIIGFGMRQAWVMTGAPVLQISGPYRVGSTGQGMNL